MHKRLSNTEKYVGLNWIAKSLELDRKLVHYWAVKSRLRTFRFSQVRYIELNDAICLVDFLDRRFSEKDFSQFLDELNQKLN